VTPGSVFLAVALNGFLFLVVVVAQLIGIVSEGLMVCKKVGWVSDSDVVATVIIVAALML
jgi:hypothetical protein